MDAVCDNCSEYFDPKVIEEICDKCFSEDMNNRKSLHIKFASIEDLKQNPHVKGLLEDLGFYAEGTNWYTTASDDLCIRNCSISGDGESFGDLDEQGNNKVLLLSGRRARAKLTEWGL